MPSSTRVSPRTLPELTAQTELTALSEKVRGLEVRQRRQRLSFVGIGAVLLMAMANPAGQVITADRVEAKEFLIRDASGVRLNLRLAKDGSVGIFLRDKKGKERLALQAQADGLAGLILQDASGRERVSALSQKDGLAGLFVTDIAGKERLSMITQPDGLAALYARDTKGKERVSALTQKDGLGGVFVSDREGEPLHSFAK
jgi:hypothetical protein